MTTQPPTSEDILMRINPLTTEQRSAAEAEARRRIAGVAPVYIEPSPADFENRHFSKYSPRVVFWVNRFADSIMVAAFVPSAIRIYHAGVDVAMQTTGALSGAAAQVQSMMPTVEAQIQGAMNVMMAETGMIGFTLALALTGDWIAKRILGALAIACAAFALVGNWSVVMNHPDNMQYVFRWLEAILPPVIALGGAMMRKNAILSLNASRYGARQIYETALANAKQHYADALDQHQRMIREAETHPDWMRYYANALWDMLWAINRSGKQREEMRTYGAAEKRILVQRELRAADWWSDTPAQSALPPVEPDRILQLKPLPTQPVPVPKSTQRPGASGGDATGEAQELMRFVKSTDSGDRILHCPCGLAVPVSSQRPLASVAAHIRNAQHRTWRIQQNGQTS